MPGGHQPVHTSYFLEVESGYSAMKEYLAPSWFLTFVHICHTQMFQNIKQILILDKHNPTKCKTRFLNDNFIYKGKRLSKPTWTCVKK